MATTDSLHIVVFPWLAFGHMLPFLHLSKSLAKRGHRISFISTPNNILRLPTHDSPSSLHFIPFPLPAVDGLPATAEATCDIPHSLSTLLYKAFDALLPSFKSFLSQTSPKPDWIINDFSNDWLPAAAAAAGVPSVIFSVFSAACLAFFGPINELDPNTSSRTKAEDFTVPAPWLPCSSHLFFRLHEAQKIVTFYRPNESGISNMFPVINSIRRCKAVALRCCAELEGDCLRVLPDLLGKPVLSVGLLLPHLGSSVAAGNEKDEIFEWLEGKASCSVLYIAFGSEVELSGEQIRRIALGVELAGVGFVWAMKKQSEELPEGFVGRTSGRGVVARRWVDQLGVLAHEAVGGFLSHCGAGSAIEGIGSGKPLVMFPTLWEQGLTARVIAEKGVGVEVERREEDGSFGEEDVARAVRLVMVGEEGKTMRARCKELGRKIFADDCQEKLVDDFIQFLRNSRAD